MKKFIILVVILILYKPVYSRDFTIGVDTWAPFIFAQTKDYKGISIDYIKELTKRMNVNLVIKKVPWARSLKMLEYGQLDAVINMVETKERKKYITFTSPNYIQLNIRFYIRKNSKVSIENYEDLYRYQVGIVRGSAYYYPFDTDNKINKYSITTEKQLLLMLAKKRFEVIIGTDPQVEYEMNEQGYSSLIKKAPYDPKHKTFIRVGISKKSPYIKELDVINKYTKEIVKEGLIEKYKNKYIKCKK